MDDGVDALLPETNWWHRATKTKAALLLDSSERSREAGGYRFTGERPWQRGCERSRRKQ